jgi:hypothetical protein
MLAERALSPSKAAKILGVKPSNVYRLMSEADPPAMRNAQG